MINKKYPHLDLKPKERIIPHYLTPRMSFYSHLPDEPIKSEDSVFIINKKIQEKSQITFSENLAEIFRNSIKTIISVEEFCEQNQQSLLSKIVPDQKILEEKNFSNKINILKDGDLLHFLAIDPMQKMYIHVFESLREIYKLFGEIAKDSPNLYPIPNKNKKESEEEILYQTILNEDSIKNDYFRNEILNKVLLLQIPVENLRKMTDPKPRTLPDPALRSEIAKLGAEKSNAGQDVLIKMITDYLKNNRPKENASIKIKKIKTLSALCKEHDNEFMKIIEDYKKSYPDTKHGKTLMPYNFQRNFSGWIKNSEELKAEVYFHLSSA